MRAFHAIPDRVTGFNDAAARILSDRSAPPLTSGFAGTFV
jgi:hypothetical protein